MITELFRKLQESEESRIGRMAERVAVASIDSQKQSDEYVKPNYIQHQYYLDSDNRPRAFNSFTCVNSFFAGREGGIGSSYSTSKFYNSKAKSYRDELAKEAAAAGQES